MDELVRRLRAARGYAGISQPELAEKLGFSTSTLKRIEGGKSALQGFERDGFIRAAAEATGLPIEFFTVDREMLGRPPDLISPSQLTRPPYDEAALQDADARAAELGKAMVEEFSRAAPGAALMLQEILEQLGQVRAELRRTVAEVDPKLAKELGDAIDQAAEDLEGNARGDDPPSTATGS